MKGAQGSEHLNRESKNHISDRRTYKCKIFSIFEKKKSKIFSINYSGLDLGGEYGFMKIEQRSEHLNRESENRMSKCTTCEYKIFVRQNL